jgi:O-antigen ligase
MTSASSLLRSLLIYSICLPLAIFLGYLIAQEGNPIYSLTTYVGILPILFILALPLILRWHHGLLIASWNIGAVLFFFPGRPDLWMAMAALSLLISILQYILDRRHRFLSDSSVSRPLLFLAAVVIVTAACRGGIGLRSFGSELNGGKRYLVILAGIIGYFAFTSRQIPPKYAARYVVIFFLGFAVRVIGDLGSILPESLYFVYLLFPISMRGYASIMNDVGPLAAIDRLGGLAVACLGGFSAMLARYGIREIFASRHVFRLLVFLAFVSLSTLGGFRGNVVIFVILFSILFYLEGLMRSRLLPIFALIVVLIGALLVGFVQRLPLNVQRTLSVLQLPVDPIAKADAQASSEWRKGIWRQVIPLIPQYLILGRGLGFNGKDLQPLVDLRARDSSEAETELVSDFHNGPLSVIVPFGIAGTVGFLWFMIASARALYRNYRYGNPAYSKLNRFLFAFFITKAIFFFFAFGSLFPDIAMFTGIVGLSISLNGGIARRLVLLPPPVTLPRIRRLPQSIHPPVPAHLEVGPVS